MDVAGDGRGSDIVTGNFTVRQAVYDASGHLLNFDASFEQHSEGRTPALFGEIKYFYAPGPAGILTNDFDQEGEQLSAVLVSGPPNGTLNLYPNGSFTYQPNLYFAGTDSFTYKANDGADSNVATVTITVNPVNQAPSFTKGANQLVTENGGTQTVSAWATNVAAGPPNESWQVVNFLVSNDNNALFSVQPAIDSSGTLTYTPAPNAFGVANVTVQLHDNGGTANGGVDTSAAQTFTITLNDPPVAVNDTYEVGEGTTLMVGALGTTSLFLQSQLGDYIGNGQTMTFTPATGQFSATRNSFNGVSLSYTPNSGLPWFLDFAAANSAPLTHGFYGNVARYPFQSSNQPGLDVDGNGRGSNTVTGNFTVTEAYYDASGNVLNFDASFEQHSEGAVPALFGEIQYNALSAPAGVMANDIDFVGYPLTAILVTGPAHGQLTLNSNGTFTYSPNAGFSGTDTFTYKANDGYLDSNVPTVTINVLPPSSFSVTGFPLSNTAGVANTITVTAQNADGTTATGYTGTVHFTSSDPEAALPADYTFTSADAGVHTFTATLKTAGSQSLTATDTMFTTLTGTQANIAVSPAAVSRLAVTGFPSPSVAGTAQTFTVTAQDAYANLVASYRGTVRLTSSDRQASLPANYTFTSTDNGVHVFTATLKTAGLQSLVATDTTNSTITGTQTGITVSPAAAKLFAVTGFPSPTIAGTAHNTTVTVKDAYGNIASGYTGTVHFTSTDSRAALPSNYTFTATDAGVHTFAVTLKTAGTQSITVKDTVTGTIAGTQSGITVSPAALSQLRIAAPSSATAGVAFSITVTAQDAYGNTVASYTATVHFTSNDTKAILPPDYTFVATDAGKHTFTSAVTLKTANKQTITATDTTTTSITGSAMVNVLAAAASILSVTGPATATAGTAFTFTVTALDPYGNKATSYRGTVHFTSSDPRAVLPGDYTFTSANNGSHSFTSGATLKTAGPQSITATDTLTSSITGQFNVTVNPAAASVLEVTGFPNPIIRGTAGTFTVTALDAYGNVATGYRGIVHFTSSDTAASLPANYTFSAGDAGTHTFTATLNTIGTQSITATDTAHPTITGSESGIQVSAPMSANSLRSKIANKDYLDWFWANVGMSLLRA